MKIRLFPDSNYKSIFINGKTIRLPLNNKFPISELKYAEFYDIALGTYCRGNCKFCYASANKRTGVNYNNVAHKILTYFEQMDKNQRPFQVAIGGGGEPLEHPEFEHVLQTFVKLGIVPNYTTNGMLFNEKIAKITKKYCGGVAITLHPHLQKYWIPAIELALQYKIKVNCHVIISDKNSIEYLDFWYNKYNGKIDYFVLLPYMNVGYAAKFKQNIDYNVLKKWVDRYYKNQNIAFGVNFFEFLKLYPQWQVSLYPPEIFSKYLECDDNMTLYNNSFEKKRVI